MKKSKRFRCSPLFCISACPDSETVQLIRECEKIMNAQSTTGDFMSSTPKKPTALSANIRTYALKMSANLKALKEMGGVLATVAGHDHLNCFEGKVDKY